MLGDFELQAGPGGVTPGNKGLVSPLVGSLPDEAYAMVKGWLSQGRESLST